MFYLAEWLETEEKKHNAEWANKMISFIRFYMLPLVNTEHAERGMAYLTGTQDMSPIRDLFINPQALNLDNQPAVATANRRKGQKDIPAENMNLQAEMQSVSFRSLPIMEKIVNMLVAEMKKMAVIVEAKANDPSSTAARKHDEALIKNKKEIEGLLNYVYTSIGQTPYSMDHHEARFGEKVDNGNTQDFDKMGLDAGNPQDVNFFMQNFHKLAWEIAAQMPVDFFMQFNQVEEIFFENWVKDLVAKKAVACQVFVDQITGAVRYNYASPETVHIYGGGRQQDFNDANAKVIQQAITIKELLERVGDSFSFEDEIDQLFMAINSCSNGAIDITAIKPDDRGGYYFQDKNDTKYSYQQFMNFKVTFGYVEWNSQIETEYEGKLKEYDKKEKSTGYQDNQPANGKRYQTKARYETPMYKAYFLALSALEHRMFDFGKKTYQQIEGSSDANYNWSILTYKQTGESIALNCAPFIDLINETWYKFKYEIRRAKPRGTDYNYDSLMAIAEDIYTDVNLSRGDKFQRILSWADSAASIVWTFPIIDGKPVALTNNQLNVDKPNGLAPEIMRWWEILNNTWEKMLATVGLDAPLRQGSPGGSRDSMNNQFKALEYSENNTFYIPDIITYMCQELATRTMLFTQDIIQFGDIDTLAYKFLLDAVGEDTLLNISGMGKTAMHRFGVFVESVNQTAQRAKLKERLDFAIQNGKISNAEALLIEDMKSSRKAFLVLAYFEQRNKALEQKSAMEQQKAQSDAIMQGKDMDMKSKQMEIDGKLQEVTLQGRFALQQHASTDQAGITKTVMKLEADTKNIFNQLNADIVKLRQEVSAGAGNALPGAPPIQPVGPAGPPATPEQPLSGLQQQINGSEPNPTTLQQQ